MRGLLRGALASLRASVGRALLVGLGLCLAVGLPALVTLGVADLAEAVRSRARSVPLLVGAPGAATDLVLGCLYYRGEPEGELPLSARDDLLERQDVEVVPMVLGASAQGHPVVGLDVGWFELTGLELAKGRRPGVIGEVVLGSTVARELGLGVGSEVISDPPARADFVGPTSVVLEVVGVLAETGGPDDGAVFTDLSTAWLLQGALHGHAEVKDSEALPAGSRSTGSQSTGSQSTGAQSTGAQVTEASAAVFLFERLSAEERARVHGHGDGSELPVSGLLLFPRDARAHDQVLADLELDAERRITRPVVVVERVLAVVLQVRRAVLGLLVLIGLSCLGLLAVLLRLDWRLRAEERALVARLGGPRWWVGAQMAVELILISTGAVLAASGLVALGRVALLGLLGGP